MDSGDAALLLSIIILMALSAFFSSSETALTAVNKVRIKTLADEGDPRAVIAEKLLDDQPRLINALLIGNNIVNTAMTAIATVFVTNWLGNKFLGVSTGVLTILILIFCETTPKNCAAASAESLSLHNARIVYMWVRIITPVSIILNLIVHLLMRALGVDPDYRDTFTETEIRTIVDESHEGGAIETEEREMINNVFDLSENTARDIMMPRVDIVFLDVNATYKETLDMYRECRYTRMPVCDGDSDNIVGMLNIKDLVLQEDIDNYNVRDIMREVSFTYENKKTSELMQEMLNDGISMVVVLDEYGDTVGLVTMEDLLEEIVGEIRDEFDENEEQEKVFTVGDNEYIVEGSAKLEDLKNLIDGFDMESDEYDSIGGVITGLLGRLPETGDEVKTENGYTLRVETLNNTHIEKVRVTVPSPDTGNEASPVSSPAAAHNP